MSMGERVVLYALVYGLRPDRVLEIGTFRGGSSMIISAALDDVGSGNLVCVDPVPQVAPDNWAQIEHRATMLAGPSPAILDQATAAAGGRFDFALIDGDHSYDGVIADIEGTLPLMADDAHILFHDAHYFEVAEALVETLTRHPDVLIDCGMISTEQTQDPASGGERPVIWGGLRMLRYRTPL